MFGREKATKEKLCSPFLIWCSFETFDADPHSHTGAHGNLTWTDLIIKRLSFALCRDHLCSAWSALWAYSFPCRFTRQARGATVGSQELILARKGLRSPGVLVTEIHFRTDAPGLFQGRGQGAYGFSLQPTPVLYGREVYFHIFHELKIKFWHSLYSMCFMCSW